MHAASALPALLARRERGAGPRGARGGGVEARGGAGAALWARAGVECVLEGHGGCVNALAWNAAGTLLASGSDDTRLGVWDGFGPAPRRGPRALLPTGHEDNIFGVRWLPGAAAATPARGCRPAWRGWARRPQACTRRVL